MAASSKKISVIVAGSRNVTSYHHIAGHLDLLFAKWDNAEPGAGDVEIVSGTARGVDQLGEKYARRNGLECKKFPADWDRFGKSAGYKRNEQMAEYADALVAFWDGCSRGTRHMINLAKAADISVSIIPSEPRSFTTEEN